MSGGAVVCPPPGLSFGGEYYSVVNGVCTRAESYFGGKPVLNQGVGYAVVLGFGAFFAVFTSFLVWLEKRYVGGSQVQTSEWFNTAGRSVKTGLIASVIVSQWTWAATILQSSNVAWQYGVSGPFWYASGATVQVLLFGIMAIEIKRKAPNAHTVCEIVRARWGSSAHVVFLVFCLATNVIVTAMLLLGGSAVVHALTGVDVYAASFLIPLGVIVYTLAGGLKATFLASYIHSVVVHAVLLIFVFLVYTSSSKLGSPKVVYERLVAVASAARVCSGDLARDGQSCGPVHGNMKGSYLTMLSSGGLVFGIINIVGNFGTVFVDNGYWMSAIAARPSSTHKGYLLGGLVWFAVPFSLATSLGLGALALDLPLTAAEAAKGLVPPATATALMGKSGSVLLLTMLFMAVTSAGSAELVAVSSLCTYDIYRTYVNPKATGKQILAVSRAVILGFGCFMGVLAVILNLAGVSLGWMYLAMGVLVGSAVIPIALLLLWEKANAIGAMLGAVIGCILGVTVWLTVTKVQYGRVNLDTTGRNAPMLAGNLVSILVGGAVHAVCSLVSPQNYDWESTRQITTVESVAVDGSDADAGEEDEVVKEERLVHAKRWIVRWGVAFTVLIVVLWPALSVPAGRFSLGYFTLWAVIAIVWGTVGSAVIILLPLVESWETISMVCAGMYTSAFKRSTNATMAIYDVMQLVRADVSTIGMGTAGSTASIILGGGTKGKRFAMPNTRIMMHQPVGGASGQALDVEVQAKEILASKRNVIWLVSGFTGRTMEQVEKDIDRDRYMGPLEAVDYGFIDGVIDGDSIIPLEPVPEKVKPNYNYEELYKHPQKFLTPDVPDDEIY